MEKIKNALPYIIWIAICLIGASLAGSVTGDHLAWFATLQKPSFNPPSWVFGPVWTVLYILIGIAGAKLWHQRRVMKSAFAFYIIQLVFNFLWSFVFFGAQQIGLAIINMLLIILFVVLTLIKSRQHAPSVIGLLLPYLLWLGFALVLNVTLWQLN